MNLVLAGTIAHADPQRGFAIVGESAATARVYAVGKTIAGGTKLHSVHPWTASSWTAAASSRP